MSRVSPARAILALVLLTILFASVSRPAAAQVETREGIALQNQIMELRREIQALHDQGGRGGAPTNLGRGNYPPPPAGTSDIVAQLLSRVDALEEQVRQLRGRVDETQNQVQRQGAELGKRIEDMGFQSQNPQAGGPPGSVPTPPPYAPPGTMSSPPGGLALVPPPSALGTAPPPQQPQVPVRRTPETALQEGHAALARRDYTAAEQAAREILTGNRTSPRAYDAQFLLAEALTGERQFSQAAIAYDDVYNRARKGAHAQDALLGLANSLAAINEKRAACDTITKFHAEFPAPRVDLRDALAGASQRAGCR
jgi:TolA-binding protein